MTEHARSQATKERVYQSLIDLTRQQGRPPTYREIQAHAGISSVSVVSFHIARLIQERRVERLTGTRLLRPVGTLVNGEPVGMALRRLSDEVARQVPRVAPMSVDDAKRLRTIASDLQWLGVRYLP